MTSYACVLYLVILCGVLSGLRPLYSFDSTQPLGCLNHWAASVAQWLEHLSSKQCVVGSNPTRAALFCSFFFSEKKELFGLVAFPFFLFIEKSFHVFYI